MTSGIVDLVVPDLADLAARLDGAARRLRACAAQAAVATSTTWRGQAATLHRDRVEQHAADLRRLAEAVEEAARLVRSLEAVARSRLEVVGRVERGTGDWGLLGTGRR